MKRSEMLSHLETFFKEQEGKNYYYVRETLAKDILFLIETMGMTPPVNLKKYTATYNSREWEPENG